MSAAGMAAGGACWTAAMWQSWVVVLLDRASANSAEGVDILGRCLTSTEVPRNAEMMWMARKSCLVGFSFCPNQIPGLRYLSGESLFCLSECLGSRGIVGVGQQSPTWKICIQKRGLRHPFFLVPGENDWGEEPDLVFLDGVDRDGLPVSSERDGNESALLFVKLGSWSIWCEADGWGKMRREAAWDGHVLSCSVHSIIPDAEVIPDLLKNGKEDVGVIIEGD